MIQIDRREGRFINNPNGQKTYCSTRYMVTVRKPGFRYDDHSDYIYDISDTDNTVLIPRLMTEPERVKAKNLLVKEAFEAARKKIQQGRRRAPKLSREATDRIPSG
ncbi:MAG TPA: hypothetical protein VGF13_09740 [Verrucomicrobiae bacterium]|jgi:hypothetical protein